MPNVLPRPTRRPLDLPPHLRHARRLHDRAHRDRHGRVLVSTVRLCLAAVAAGAPVERVYASRPLLRSRPARELLAALRARGVPEHRVAPGDFRRIMTSRRACGLAAVVRQRWTPVADLPRHPGLWLACGAIARPGNLGTLLRSAAALGARGLVCLGPAMDPHDANVLCASRGAVFDLRLVRAAPHELGAALRQAGWPVIGTSARATLPLARARLPSAAVVVVGNEGRGMSDEERALCDEVVAIPTRGPLNVGVAGSLVIYEWWRRRSALGQPGFFHESPSGS